MPCYFPLKLLVISHFFYLLSNHFSMLSLNKNEERIRGCSDASTICPGAQIYTPILPNSHTNTQSTTQAEIAPNDIWRTYALATGPTIWVTDVCFKRHWNELAGNKKESEWEGRRVRQEEKRRNAKKAGWQSNIANCYVWNSILHNTLDCIFHNEISSTVYLFAKRAYI